MHALYDLLNASPLLILFVVLALGSVVGAVPVGPLKFGTGGALFVGLLFGALFPAVGPELGLLKDMGLALFAYLIGLTAGQTFFRDLTRSWPFMLASVAVVIVTAAASVVVGDLLGLDRPTAVGAFSGALTSTPSMALAHDITGSTSPAVGYSISYLVGIVVAILILAVLEKLPFPATKDAALKTDEDLSMRTVKVRRDVSAADLDAVADADVRMVALRRGRTTTTLSKRHRLRPGDQVLLDGTTESIERVADAVGELERTNIVGTLGSLQIRTFLVSSSLLAEQPISALSLHRRFGARITRVRRDDGEILASEDLELKLGDRVLVVAPRGRSEALESFFGHSTRSLSDIDWVSVGLGMAAAYALALVMVPLPGGASFALGSAAGALLAGLLLGAVGRTRHTVWQVPATLNLTLRQFGLMLFMGAVGLASGPAFVSSVATPVGLKSIALAVVDATLACVLVAAAARLLGQSTPRTLGGIAGLFAQPAILDFATARTTDARVMSGYAQLFAITLIVKIAVVPFML